MNNQQLKQSLLKLIQQPNFRPCKIQGILAQLSLDGSRRKHVRKILKELTDQKLIRKDEKNRFAPLRSSNRPERIVKGRLSIHPQGFGFLAIDADEEDAEIEELFIPPSKMDTARNGDRVLAKVVPNTGGGKRGGND